MANYFYTGTYSSSIGGVFTYVAGDSAIFLPGSTVVSSVSHAIYAQGSSISLSIGGSIAGIYQTIILGTQNGSDSYGMLQLLAGASVQSFYTAIEVGTANSSITNAGTISGIIGISTGFFNTGATGTFYSNSGLIDVQAAGMRLNASDQSVVNTGTILSSDRPSNGSEFMGAYIGATVGGILIRGANASINNSGDIISGSPRGYGIVVEGGGARIVNSGLVQVASTYVLRSAVSMFETAADQVNVFVNASGGRVVAPLTAVNGGIGIDIVKNHGSITGDIDLQDGSDSIINSETINGDVYLGLLSDTYLGRVNGVVTGTVYGGDGADLLTGGNLGDLLTGDAGADVIKGNNGNDELDGGADDDKVFGGDGNDTVLGGSGTDRLFGDAGDDTLFGGADRDYLYGGSGEDVLIGGSGRDILMGGTGADQFVFLNSSDSTLSTGGDIIRDFERGIDIIDLDAVYSGDLEFVGNAAFTGGGVASLRVVNSAGHSFLFVDVNGDAVADMRIVVLNTLTMDLSDFVL